MDYELGDWNGPLDASGLSSRELWLAYFALGGDATRDEFDQLLEGTSQPSAKDHNLVAHALNERFNDLGLNSPVPYRGRD